VVFRLASVRVVLTGLIFVENPDTPVLGVVCDLPRARVTFEKYTVVLKSTSVRTWFTDVIFVENLDTPLIRSCA